MRVGIEGSGSYGRALALELERAGVHVVEVPPHLTARERRRDRKAGKTDDRDALIVARITLREDDLPSIKPSGVHEDLAALVGQRDCLVGERTRIANRVHGLLAVLAPGYASRCGHLRTAKAITAARTLIAQDTGVRAGIVRSNLDRLGASDRDIRELAEAQAQLVAATRTTLTDLDGVGSLVAARILAEVGDVRRYTTKDKFARANGTAPIPASSGRSQRYRLNPGGNRQLNRALHTMALTQIRCHPDARAYYERKRKENKTGRDALRCLKRRLSDVVYRHLQADARAALT